jgi:hypothetical protein
MLPRPTAAARSWRAGEVFVHDAAIAIPSNAAPGAYQVGVHVVELEAYNAGTFLERVLLEDDERYSTAWIGSIQIPQHRASEAP